MVFSGLEPLVTGWKAQTNPLSYGDHPLSKVDWYTHQKLSMQGRAFT